MKSYICTAFVLKRSNVAESDRIVTLFTKEQGKLSCVAKGARKMSSSKLGALEPGNLVKVFLIPTKGMPILTQAQLQEDFPLLKGTLPALRKLFQILEMLDSILMEGDIQEEVFALTQSLFDQVCVQDANVTHIVRLHFERILAVMGLEHEDPTIQSITAKIEEATQRKLKAFAYLS